jgi:predicted ribonuclease toxin of YeeF-YezG toxin-antitoxin module
MEHDHTGEIKQRVTINHLYQKQLDNEKLLIELNAKMTGMPERVRDLELRQAKNAWIEKVAYAGLLAGITAVVGGLISIL